MPGNGKAAVASMKNFQLVPAAAYEPGKGKVVPPRPPPEQPPAAPLIQSMGAALQPTRQAQQVTSPFVFFKVRSLHHLQSSEQPGVHSDLPRCEK